MGGRGTGTPGEGGGTEAPRCKGADDITFAGVYVKAIPALTSYRVNAGQFHSPYG